MVSNQWLEARIEDMRHQNEKMTPETCYNWNHWGQGIESLKEMEK